MKLSPCGRAQSQMLLYLAGELPLDKAAWLRDHARTCPACQARLQALAATQQQVKTALASASLTAPAGFEARCMARVRHAAPTRRSPRFRSPLAPIRTVEKRILFALAGLALVAGTYFAAHTLRSGTTLTNASGEVVAATAQVSLLRDDYLHELQQPLALPITGSDPSEVAKQLGAQVCPAHQQCVVPVVMSQPGVKLLGGGWCQVGTQKITYTAYQWDGQRVVVYQGDQNTLAFPPPLYHPAPDGDLCYEPVQSRGVSGVVWGKGATRYVMFAPIASDRLLNLAYSVQYSS